jgi:hypothetical protein
MDNPNIKAEKALQLFRRFILTCIFHLSSFFFHFSVENFMHHRDAPHMWAKLLKVQPLSFVLGDTVLSLGLNR